MSENGAHSGATGGFTLVELLIVVVIVGVLAIIAISTFRRMISKARQAEAKVGLGALYIAEASFYTDFGTYGNHIGAMELELSYAAPSIPDWSLETSAYAASFDKIYRIGFPSPGGQCGDYYPTVPAPYGSQGELINDADPNYFVGLQSTVGRFTLNTCVGSDVIAGVTVEVRSSDSSNTYDSYTASATGVIKGGVDRDNPAVADTDAWTIDEKKTLINVQSGL